MSASIETGGLKTFNELISLIGDTLGRSDLLDMAPIWVRLVEKELERDLPLRDSEYIVNGNFVVDQEFIELPKNLLELEHISVNTGLPYNLNLVSIDKLNDVRTNGIGMHLPLAMRQIGLNLHIAPTPTIAEEYTLVYSGSLPPLGGDQPSNKVLEDAPDCLFYGALTHSAPYIGDDDRVALWFSFYDRAKNSYLAMEKRNRTGGGPLHVRPDMVPYDAHIVRGLR